MSQVVEILRRESLISVLSEKQHIERGYSDKIKNAPKDSFYICYIFFFLMGFMTLMPMVFIGTAANYWMYKFRNVSATGDDAANRTSLQSLYQSSSMVATSLPLVVFTLLTTIYGKQFDARKMSLCALTAMFTIFFTFSVFTRIDTDSWQEGFFAMTMILLGLNSSSLAIYQLVSMTILAKFPSNFMKSFLLGQSGGILTDVLQVISISVTDSDTDGALIYFVTGTLLIAISICLSFSIKYTKTYAYYSKNNSDENEKKEKPSWSEMKEVARLIWPALTLVVTVMLTMSCVHPAVSSLVASEHQQDGGAWEKKYFTPVIAFLLSDVSSMVGRIISMGKISKSNFPFWMTGMIIRAIVSVGIIIFCNAQPRSHLPVVFHEDWVFILWGVLYHLSGGFIMNLIFLSLHQLSAGKSEVALKLISIVFSVTSAIFSANGIIVVKLL